MGMIYELKVVSYWLWLYIFLGLPLAFMPFSYGEFP